MPGSRLFKTLFGLPRKWEEYREILRHVPKRLPSSRNARLTHILLNSYSKYFASRSRNSARALNRMLLTAGTVVRITRAISS